MHGSVEDANSIVLTRKDFRETLFTKPKYREFLRRLFTDSTIFFYGYSFGDPNVDFVLQEIMAMYEGMARPHYALLPDLGAIAKKYWLVRIRLQEQFHGRCFSAHSAKARGSTSAPVASTVGATASARAAANPLRSNEWGQCRTRCSHRTTRQGLPSNRAR